MKINNHIIGGYPPFVIAEIGSNHMGSIDIAKESIDIAKDCGADSVKFQGIIYNKLYNDSIKFSKQLEFDESWYGELMDYCGNDIIFSVSPTYLELIDLLEELNISYYKIASPQTYAFPQLIAKIAKTNKPIIMSTGYCTASEIKRAINIIEKERQFDANLALLHCISEYPLNPNNANLLYIKTMKDLWGYPVGFSDHSKDIYLSLIATCLGADIIEKHLISDITYISPDSPVSINPEQFKTLINLIKSYEKYLGDGIKYTVSDSELALRETLTMYSSDKFNFKRDIIGKNAWDWYSD